MKVAFPWCPAPSVLVGLVGRMEAESLGETIGLLELRGIPGVIDLLQEDDVGVLGRHDLLELLEAHPAAVRAAPLADVPTQDAQRFPDSRFATRGVTCFDHGGRRPALPKSRSR